MDKEGSFIRWQKITIDQMSYIINLIIGLSVASIGYFLTYLINDQYSITSCRVVLLLISLLSIFISIVLGIYCVYNRLRDFRATKEAARLREKGEPNQKYIDLYNKLGPISWQLFKIQIITFLLGTFLGIIIIVFTIIDKYFYMN